MKKTLTIILLSISLSGISQTEKSDWVVTPTVGWNTLKIDNTPQRDILEITFPVMFHKYLSDRFAIGCGLEFDYYAVKPYVVNSYEYSSASINLIPEVRYNFLKTRFTPFISGRMVEFGYVRQFADDPSAAVSFRNRTNFRYLYREGPQINVGVSYFIKERFGLQVKLMDVNKYWNFKEVNTNFYTPVNFGLQFIINNPRAEN